MSTTATGDPLPPWMRRIEDSLKPFQKRMREHMITRPASAIWAGVGSGKTITTLSGLSLLREPGHILIVAPRNIAVDVWPQEIIDWEIPLSIVSLNITPPGMLDSRGKPIKGQRDLQPAEFSDIVASVPVCSPRIYTVGYTRLPELVDQIANGGPPRTRPIGVPHPDGIVDLDAVRDGARVLLRRLISSAKTPAELRELAVLANRHQVVALHPATASGLPPTVVFAHPDPDVARVLRGEDLREELARLLGEVMGTALRVAVNVAQPDYSRWPFPTVVLDEAQSVKNRSSSRWRALHRVRPHTRRIVELSGTPSPEGLHELWAQIHLLDNGAALGTNYTDHLEEFFTPDKIVNNEVVRWKISAANEKLLHERIAHLATSEENTELNLPGFAPIHHHRIEIAPELLAAYETFKQSTVLSVLVKNLDKIRAEAREKVLLETADPAAMAAALTEVRGRRLSRAKREQALAEARGAVAEATGDHQAAQRAADGIDLGAAAATISAKNAGVLRNRLMQFATGALYLDPDELDAEAMAAATVFTKRPISLIHTGKQDKILQICQEHFDTGKDGSVLISYRFDYEKPLILKKLHDAGFTDARAFNGMPDTKRAWNRREIPIMLIHPASAGHGLNLQKGGHTLIWSTLPDSNEHYQQVPGRLNRPGQTHRVDVHILTTIGTIDETMVKSLDRKQATQQRLLEATRADVAAAFDQALAQLAEGSSAIMAS